MEYKYLDYRSESFKGPSSWPKFAVETCDEVLNETRVLEFFDRFNDLLSRLVGYGPMYRPLFEELGALEGCSHMRFFRADTGREYTAIHRKDGKFLTADEISNGAFMVPYFKIHSPRAMRPIRVREGRVLHLAVDADFTYWGAPLDGYDAIMKSYTAKLA